MREHAWGNLSVREFRSPGFDSCDHLRNEGLNVPYQATQPRDGEGAQNPIDEAFIVLPHNRRPLARGRSERYVQDMSRSVANQSESRASAVSAVKAHAKRSRIKFGGITVLVPKPSSSQVKLNVAASSLALERTAKRLMRPGVRLHAKKGVPQYSADPERPGVYIRVLNGTKDRGVLENGEFKVID